MFKVFYGDNRQGAERAIKQTLGEGYEVFEGENLSLTDLPSIFQGSSLFETENRRILLKDVGENAVVWEKVVDYVETPHEVICWEMKLDKRSSGYKRLKNSGVELREFAELRRPGANLVFNILDTALEDGARAVKMVEQIELAQDPYMFFGLMVTQALKKFEQSGGRSGCGLLKRLAELDMRMKSASVEPWTLVKAFLLEIGG